MILFQGFLRNSEKLISEGELGYLELESSLSINHLETCGNYLWKWYMLLYYFYEKFWYELKESQYGPLSIKTTVFKHEDMDVRPWLIAPTKWILIMRWYSSVT